MFNYCNENSIEIIILNNIETIFIVKKRKYDNELSQYILTNKIIL
jgi:hypothetical protein